MFRVERGATGFRGRTDPVLPTIEVRRFRAACFAVGAAVERVEERVYPDTFHVAVVGGRRVRCHVVHPWIAFDGDVPEWAATFAAADFVVLDRGLLDAPLSAVDTSALTAAEWDQIRHWQPATVGEALFNSWD